MMQKTTPNLTELFTQIHKIKNFSTALSRTIEYLCLHFEYVLGEAWVPSNQAEKGLEYLLTFHVEKLGLGEFVRASNHTHFQKGIGLPGRAWESGMSEWVDDIALLSDKLFKRHDLAKAANLHQALALPILQDDQIVTVLVLFKQKEEQKNALEFTFIESVALELGFLLERIRAEEELSRAKSQSDAILKHTHDGLFLLNPNFQISNQFSVRVAEFLNEKNPSDRNLVELLRPLISSKEIDDLERYLSLMFNADIEFEMLENLNPCRKIQFYYPAGSVQKVGVFSFTFTRIFNAGKISNLFVTMFDMTTQTELSDKLEKLKLESLGEMSLFSQILHIDPNLLRDFLQQAGEELQEGLFILHESAASSVKEKLEDLYIKIHNIKGNALMIGHEPISNASHLVEEEISHLLKNNGFQSSQFVALIVLLETISEKIQQTQSIIEKLLGFGLAYGKAKNNSEIIMHSAETLIKALSQKTKQLAHVHFGKLELEGLELNFVREIKNMLIQLIRNTFAHGLEEPEERLSRGKDEVLNIKIQIHKTYKEIVLLYEDDGHGIDLDALEQSARARGITIAKAAPRISLLFFTGISTKEAISDLAGRGVGMSLIRQVLQKYQGSMKIKTKKHEGLKFQFNLGL